MKIPKSNNSFRLSEEIRVSLEVLADMTGTTMTEMLEACVRIGKKTVAKTRGLDYQEVLYNITTKRNNLQVKRNPQKYGQDPNWDKTVEETIEIAKTKWLDD